MIRSGYDDACDGWELICWRVAVASAIRGRRGQAALRDMLAEMEAMPVKELISGELITESGVCALGALAIRRAVDLARLDAEDSYILSEAFVKEVAFENDERMSWYRDETPEQRWLRMRDWIIEHLHND